MDISDFMEPQLEQSTSERGRRCGPPEGARRFKRIARSGSLIAVMLLGGCGQVESSSPAADSDTTVVTSENTPTSTDFSPQVALEPRFEQAIEPIDSQAGGTTFAQAWEIETFSSIEELNKMSDLVVRGRVVNERIVAIGSDDEPFGL